jgi:hypothetical protein
VNWSGRYSIFGFTSSLRLDPVSRDIAWKPELTVSAEMYASETVGLSYAAEGF